MFTILRINFDAWVVQSSLRGVVCKTNSLRRTSPAGKVKKTKMFLISCTKQINSWRICGHATRLNQSLLSRTFDGSLRRPISKEIFLNHTTTLFHLGWFVHADHLEVPVYKGACRWHKSSCQFDTLKTNQHLISESIWTTNIQSLFLEVISLQFSSLFNAYFFVNFCALVGKIF